MLATIFWLALKFPYLSPYCTELDTANYIRGAVHFDPVHGSPQLPGFPLWILLLRGLSLAGLTGPLAVWLLALAFCVAALIVFHRCARQMLEDRLAGFLTLLLAFCPTVLLYSVSASIYTVDLCFSALIGWLCWRIWRGEPRLALHLCVCTSIGLGIRQNGLLFLLPLVAASLAIAARRHPARVALGIGCATLIGVAWLVPVLVASGGYAEYSAASREHLVRGFRLTSPYFGATWLQYFGMLKRAAAFLTVALGGLAAAAVVASARPRTPSQPLPGSSHWFWFLWIAPYALFLLAVHFFKPGYFCLLLPPMFLLAGRIFLHFRSGENDSDEVHFGWALAAGLAVSLALALTPLPEFVRIRLPNAAQFWRESTLPAAADALRRQQTLAALLFAGETAANTFIIPTRDYYDAPVRVTVPTDFPDAVSADLTGENLVLFRHGRTYAVNELPANIERVLMVCWPGELPPVQSAGGRTARSVYRDAGMQVWSLELPVAEVLLSIQGPSGKRHELRRARPPVAGSLGAGFSALEGDKVHPFRWALGPSSHISADVAPRQTATLVLEVAASIHPELELVIELDGSVAARFSALRAGQLLRVPLPAGTASDVTLRYSRWNGQPRLYVQNDSRQLAVMFSRIAIEHPASVFDLLR